MSVAYIATSILKNAIKKILGDIASNPNLGMENHSSIKWKTLDKIGHLKRDFFINLDGATVLELGPGKTPDLMISFMLAGAKSVIWRDVVNRLPSNWNGVYRAKSVESELDAGAAPFFRSAFSNNFLRAETIDFEGMSGGVYDGVNIDVPGGSVDFVFSKSVLEHVSRSSAQPVLNEHFRILAPGGYSFHAIDLRDHMHIFGDEDEDVFGNWLDMLRYSETFHDWMTSNRPGYVNRYRALDWKNMFMNAGFEIIYWNLRRIDLPVGFSGADSVNHKIFNPDEDYSIAWVEVLAQKPFSSSLTI